MRSGRVAIELVIGTPAPESFKLAISNADCFVFSTEIAYTFRYVDTNGRTEGSPWSIRQTAVYQKINLKTGCSIWILIQPNDAVLERFKALCLQSVDGAGHPMAPHLTFLSSARVHWKAYIGQLRLSLQKLVSGRTLTKDYSYTTRRYLNNNYSRMRRPASPESAKHSQGTTKSLSPMVSNFKRFVISWVDQCSCSEEF